MHPLIEEQLYESEYYNHHDEIIVVDSEDEENYDSDIDTDDNDDDEYINGDVWSYLYNDEEDYMMADKVHLKHYIGLPGYIRKYNELIFLCGISARTFYKYDITNVTRYLSDSSVSYVHNPKVHILQLIISTNGVHNVVLKTFWLRLVQRTYKNVLRKRQAYNRRRMMLRNMYLIEINGSLNDHYPTLRGMLMPLILFESKQI